MSAHPIVQLEVGSATEEDWLLIRERIKDMQPIIRDETRFSVLTALPSAELLSFLQAGLSAQCSVLILGRHTLVHDDRTFGS